MGKVPVQASQLLVKKHSDPLGGPGVLIHNIDADDSFFFPLPPGPEAYHARLENVLLDWQRDLILDYTSWLLVGPGDDDWVDRLLDRIPPDDPTDGATSPLPKGPHGKTQEIQQAQGRGH